MKSRSDFTGVAIAKQTRDINERDLKYPIYAFATSIFRVTKKLTKRALVTPTTKVRVTRRILSGRWLTPFLLRNYWNVV